MIRLVEYRYQLDQWVVYLSSGLGVGIKSQSGLSLYIPGSIKNNIFIDFNHFYNDTPLMITLVILQMDIQCEECPRIMLKECQKRVSENNVEIIDNRIFWMRSAAGVAG